MAGGPLVPILQGFVDGLGLLPRLESGSDEHTLTETTQTYAFAMFAAQPALIQLPYEVRRDAFVLMSGGSVESDADEGGIRSFFDRFTRDDGADDPTTHPRFNAMRILVEIRIGLIAPAPSPLGGFNPRPVIEGLDEVISICRTLPDSTPQLALLRDIAVDTLRAEVSALDFNMGRRLSVTSAFPLIDEAIELLQALLERIDDDSVAFRAPLAERRDGAIRSRLFAKASTLSPPPMGDNEAWISLNREWVDFETQRHHDRLAGEALERDAADATARAAGDDDPEGFADATVVANRLASQSHLTEAELRLAEAELGGAALAGDLDAFDEAGVRIAALLDTLVTTMDGLSQAQLDAKAHAGVDLSMFSATDIREDIDGRRHLAKERARRSELSLAEARSALVDGDQDKAFTAIENAFITIQTSEVNVTQQDNRGANIVSGSNNTIGAVGDNVQVGAVGQGASNTGGVGDGDRSFSGDLKGIDPAQLAADIRAVRDALALQPEDAEALAEAEKAAEEGDESTVVSALKRVAKDVWEQVVAIGSVIGLEVARGRLQL